MKKLKKYLPNTFFSLSQMYLTRICSDFDGFVASNVLTKVNELISIDFHWLPQTWCAWIRSHRGLKPAERTSRLCSTYLCDSTALNPPCKGLSPGRSIPWREFRRRWIWRAYSCHRLTILKLSSLVPRTNYLWWSTMLRYCTPSSNSPSIRSPVISTDIFLINFLLNDDIFFKKKEKKEIFLFKSLKIFSFTCLVVLGIISEAQSSGSVVLNSWFQPALHFLRYVFLGHYFLDILDHDGVIHIFLVEKLLERFHLVTCH